MKIDLGSGRAHFEDYTTVDKDPKVGADIQADILNLPLEDESVDEIRAHHILEHLPNDKKVEIMKEMWRVLKKNGIISIEVPIAGTQESYQDPTHISYWHPATFWYFTKDNNFGEAFIKRHDSVLFEKVEEKTENWKYNIKFKKV